MKEYYKDSNWHYKMLKKAKGGVRVLQVGKNSIFILELPADWLTTPSTKAQFDKAGKRIVDKIIKAIGD